jgi:arylsulfatase A
MKSILSVLPAGFLALAVGLLPAIPVSAAPAKPNIVLILADDAGIGDYEPYNTLFKTSDSVALVTPNIRRLADEGQAFTRAHSTGAVCQPSRFSIISGLFPIRKSVSGTTRSIDDRFIEGDRATLPAFLRQQGYRTAIVGKWHLDYILPTKAGGRARAANIDPAKPLPLGAEDYGFDYGFWLTKGHGFAFIENRRIVKLTSQRDYAEAWPDRPAWPGHARWQTANFAPDEPITTPERPLVADAITDKALDFLETAARDRVPFFLYLPVISPHAPHIPGKEINGQPLIDGAKNRDGSPANNNRQICVYENDLIVGQVVEQLRRLKLSDNTLVIFASDNGTGAPGANKDGGSGPYRGFKGTAWEGGNREPLIIKWPGVVRPGTTTDALVSQVDFFRTFADLLGVPLPKRAALDSESFLPVLLGKATSARTHSISTKHKAPPHDALAEGYFNVGVTRDDDMKLLAAFDSATSAYKPIELYDLKRDRAEKQNLLTDAKHAGTVAELMTYLNSTLARDAINRTTSGNSIDADE